MCKLQNYRKLVNILKKKCPLAYPVSVRRVKLKDLEGDCGLESKRFDIRISRSLKESGAIDTLIHEWAHARAWNHLHDKLSVKELEDRSHDASWGVAYSEVYMIFEQNFFLENDDPVCKTVCKKCCNSTKQKNDRKKI